MLGLASGGAHTHRHLEHDDQQADARVHARSSHDARVPVALSAREEDAPADQRSDADQPGEVQRLSVAQQSHGAKRERDGERKSCLEEGPLAGYDANDVLAVHAVMALDAAGEEVRVRVSEPEEGRGREEKPERAGGRDRVGLVQSSYEGRRDDRAFDRADEVGRPSADQPARQAPIRHPARYGPGSGRIGASHARQPVLGPGRAAFHAEFRPLCM